MWIKNEALACLLEQLPREQPQTANQGSKEKWPLGGMEIRSSVLVTPDA
jgi:hypothetical protein